MFTMQPLTLISFVLDHPEKTARALIVLAVFSDNNLLIAYFERFHVNDFYGSCVNRYCC
jgi:hypothetical protein